MDPYWRIQAIEEDSSSLIVTVFARFTMEHDGLYITERLDKEETVDVPRPGAEGVDTVRRPVDWTPDRVEREVVARVKLRAEQFAAHDEQPKAFADLVGRKGGPEPRDDGKPPRGGGKAAR